MSDGFFARLSRNEQVAACLQVGETSAHHGMPGEELYSLLESGKRGRPDPIDRYRHEIQEHIKKHVGRITMSCHGDCFRHSAAKVLQCHRRLFPWRETE